MKKGKAVFIIKTLIEVLVPATFAFILLHQSYPPWFTGLFGLNTSFFETGKTTAENNGAKYQVMIYTEKNEENNPRLLAGPFREFSQSRYLILTPKAVFWFDDSKENCSFSADKISIKKNAIRTPLEITEPFKSLCFTYGVERKNGVLIYSLMNEIFCSGNLFFCGKNFRMIRRALLHYVNVYDSVNSIWHSEHSLRAFVFFRYLAEVE